MPPLSLVFAMWRIDAGCVCVFVYPQALVNVSATKKWVVYVPRRAPWCS